ncbi:MAG: hypothetical protein ABT940_03575 [Alphaproteobacteria bacterium]
MSAKDDYAKFLSEQGGEDSPKAQYQDYLRTQEEDQVQELRNQSAKGTKPPTLPPKAPNPRREALEGSKQARQVGLPPGTLESGAEALGATGGATAGALYGTQLGAPLGPMGAAAGGFLGGVAGAGLGLAGTRAAVEGGKALVGARPPITADEAIASGQRALMEGVAGEGVFRTITGIPQGYRALKSGLLAGSIKPEERALYQQAQGMGIHLSPDTLTDSKAPKMVGQTLRRTLAGGGKFEARSIENELNLRKAVDTWAEQSLGKYAGEMEQGQLLQKALKNEVIPEHKAMVSQLYKDINDRTGGAKIVDTTVPYQELTEIRDSLKKYGDTYKGAIATLDDALERLSKKGPVTGLNVKKETEPITAKIPGKSTAKVERTVTQPSLSSVEQGQKPYDKGFVTPEQSQITGIKTRTRYQEIQTGERMTGLKVTEKSDAPRQPINVDFLEAHDIRSQIGSDIGHGGPALPGKEMQRLKKAYALLTENMGKAASDYSLATGKNVNLDWALADTMNRRGKELFNESVVAKVLDQYPNKVVQTVFRKDAIGPTRELVRSLDTKPESLGLYRRSAVEELIKEAKDDASDRIVGEKFAQAARRRGEAVLKETFGENYPAFKQILEIAERMPKHQGGQGLLWFEQGMFVRFAPVVGAGAGVVMDSPGLIGASLAAPVGWWIGTRRLAEIMTNKDLTNKLLQVRSVDPRSQASIRLMSQLGAIEVGETGRPVEGRPEPRRGLLTGIGQTLMQ